MAMPKIDPELRTRLEYMVFKDRRLPEGEPKRQVVLATLSRLKDIEVTGATLADIACEEADKMVKWLSKP